MVPNRAEEVLKAAQRMNGPLWDAIVQEFEDKLKYWQGHEPIRLRVDSFTKHNEHHQINHYQVCFAMKTLAEVLKLEGWNCDFQWNQHLDIS